MDARCLNLASVSGLNILSFPFQGAFFPHVDISGEDRRNKQQHFRKTEKLQLAVNDGPGEKKDGFGVEEKKEHGDQIELHGEPFASVADRRYAALVWGELSLARLLHAHQPRHEQRHNSKSRNKDQEKQDRHPVLKHRSRSVNRSTYVDYMRKSTKGSL